jgi:hypothetical protein
MRVKNGGQKMASKWAKSVQFLKTDGLLIVTEAGRTSGKPCSTAIHPGPVSNTP